MLTRADWTNRGSGVGANVWKRTTATASFSTLSPKMME